jgi:DNA (cytosine-5)-methyltransferase 1
MKPKSHLDRGAAWPLDGRITVVLFAGMGGACDGLEAAGFPVHLAINHDEIAVAVHSKRHPHTKHLLSDVFEVDPREATGGRPVRILWASPDCTHFSSAKGSKPVSPRRRSLTWIVKRWAGTVEPETIGFENVPEIATWGPLVAKRCPDTGRVMKLDGTVAAKGERVPVREQHLVPCRKRKGKTWRRFLRGMSELGYSMSFEPRICADFGIPTIRKRMFGVMRRDGGPIVWPERSHAPRKKAKALRLKPWIGAHTIVDWSLPCYSIFLTKEEAKVLGIKRPLVPATERRIAHGVDKHVVRNPKPYIVSLTHAGDRGVEDIAEPLKTVTGAHRGEKALVVPVIGAAQHGGSVRDAADPAHTFTASRKDQNQLVVAHVTKFRPGASGVDIEDPAPTFTSNSFRKRPGGAVPLGLVTGTLIQTGYGEREGQAPRALDIGEPLGTQVAGGGKVGVVAAFMAQNNAGPRMEDNPGRSLHDPLSTTLQTGSHQGVVAVHLTELRGTSKAGREIEEPVPALMAGGRHAGLVYAFMQHYYSTGGQDQEIRDPLGATTGKARHGLVTVKAMGEEMVLSDICMRMFTPEEGAAAHGFPKGALPDEIEVGGKVRRLTKTQKYSLVGNSVPPRMVELIARANVRPALATAAD